MKELIEIQKELKAPKGQTNSFGNYKYRSCEDILEAVKPLCHKHNCLLTISDEMIMLGDRFYIKATATISGFGEEYFVRGETEYTMEKPISACVSAYAREAESKKGMDASQITGSASSYARKYALNGLFCIDDTKDADTMDNAQKAPEELITGIQKATLKDCLASFEKLGKSKEADFTRENLDNKKLSKKDAENIISRAKTALGEQNVRAKS